MFRLNTIFVNRLSVVGGKKIPFNFCYLKAELLI